MTTGRAILGRGVRFPFRPGTDGRFSLIESEDLVAQSIRLILLTRLGERQMRFDFGSDLPRLIFSPITSSTLTEIESAARVALRDWERRIRVRSVSAVPDPDIASKVILTIVYDIPQTNAQGNLVFPFYLQGG
jgi:phage baseplate assembly protein W